MNKLPSLNDLNFLKTIHEVTADLDDENQSLLKLKNAINNDDVFINLPFWNENLFEDGKSVFITPFELTLAGGSVKDINNFLSFLPAQDLKDSILPNLIKIRMDGIKHYSFASYIEPKNHINYYISSSINNRYEYGKVEFDDIVSFILPLEKFHQVRDDRACEKNDYLDLWKNLKKHGIEIQDRHEDNVYETMYRFFNNGSFNKRGDFLFSIIENCPTRWFLEEDFSKKINFILSTDSYSDKYNQEYVKQIKALIEKKVLSLNIKNNNSNSKIKTRKKI